MAQSVQRVCSLGLFLAGYIFYNSSLLEPHYSYEFSLSNSQIGIAQAAVPLGAMIGSTLAGYLVNRYGKPTLLRFCFLLISILGLISGCAFDFISLSILRFVNGALAGMLYPLCAIFLSELTSGPTLAKQTARLMFLNCLAAPAGCIAALLLKNQLAGAQLWRALILLQSIPALIAFCYVKDFKQSDYKQKVIGSLPSRYALITLCLCGTWFLMDIAYYGINFFVPYLLTLMIVKYGTLYIAVFFSLSAGLAIFIVDRVNLYKLQKYGFLLASMSLFLLAFQRQETIVLLFIVFNIALNVGPDVTTYLFSATSYPTEIRAKSHGLNAGIAKSGSVLGVLLLPILQEYYGLPFVIILLACLLFIAYLLSLLLEKLMFKDKSVKEADLVYETN